MKTALITIYPPKGKGHIAGGGVAAYAKSLAEHLSAANGAAPSAGQKVFILANKTHKEKTEYWEGGIKVLRCFDRKPRFCWQVFQTLRQLKPDVAHFQQELGMFGNIFTAFLLQWLILALRLVGIKTVITLHGVVSLENISPEFIQENNANLPVWLAKLAFLAIFKPLGLWANRLIVHDNHLKNILIKEYGFKAKKIIVVPHGVGDYIQLSPEEAQQARQKLGIAPNKKIILYLGYLTGYKGLDLLLEGFAEFARENKDAYLVIGAGEHPRLKKDPKYQAYYRGLRQRAKRLLLREQYSWPGFISEKDLPQYFSLSEVMIFPYTTFMAASGPMALALGYQVPFLASEVFEKADFANDRLIFKRDPLSLARALADFLKSAQSKNGRTPIAANYFKQLKADYAWDKVAQKTAAIYAEICPKTTAAKESAVESETKTTETKTTETKVEALAELKPTPAELKSTSKVTPVARTLKAAKARKILLLGSYGQTNLGDDALLYAYLKLFKRLNDLDKKDGRVGANTIYVNTNEKQNIPTVIRKEFPGLKYFATYGSLKESLKVLAKVDLVAFGGGTIIKELYSSTGRSKHAVTSRMLALVLLSRLAGKKVIALNIGIGNVDTFLGKLIARNILNLMSFATFRDKDSFLHARRIMGKKLAPKFKKSLDGTFLSADAFFEIAGNDFKNDVEKSVRNSVEKSLQSKTQQSGQTLGLNLLHDIPNHIDAGHFKREMIKFINQFLKNPHNRLIFFPFQVKFNLHNDLDFFKKEILPAIKQPAQVEILKDLNFANALTQLKKVDVFVGMRLHSLVFSFLANRPFVAISYSEKCAYFLKEIHYAKKVDLEALTAGALFFHLEKINTAYARIKQKLANSREKMLLRGVRERDWVLERIFKKSVKKVNE